MNDARLLIAGIGNIFLGDDAFGVEVVRRLATREVPEGVRVVDFGIRAYDLGYALQDGYETVILADATSRGGPPGSLYLIEPGWGDEWMGSLDAHAMDPLQMLRFARSLGGPLPRILLVGCEPASIDETAELPTGLSSPVEAAVDMAVGLIEQLIKDEFADRPLVNHSVAEMEQDQCQESEVLR